MIEYSISGDAQVQAHLTQLISTLRYADEPLTQAAQASLPTLRIYPPELPGQRYVRTGNLGRGWQYGGAQHEPDGASLHIFNAVPYAPDVYGDTSQRAVFAGRWLTRSQLVAQIRPIVVATFEAWRSKVLGA